MSESSSIALVTGGNRGIGLAIAKNLQAAGHRVVITYRSGTPPQGFDAVQMDVTSADSVDAGFAKIEAEIGQPEIIVANAGITKDTLVMRMSDEAFEKGTNANTTGAFRPLLTFGATTARALPPCSFGAFPPNAAGRASSSSTSSIMMSPASSSSSPRM